ncbi:MULTISPECIES: serine protease [Pseudomonadati]|uniref:Serine protease n=1 Tax=Shewanella aestuarii TaxID=1028752 RepID=A0ABT0KYJ7_9GAMM|nr:serine protease [Shewanella aestuarii]MCL1116320.1 hypothetical protein [Shewanella aestuarii]GGN84008.1 hypothetical protein GCM10009193_32760 [Shewanella aestuarii]
MKKISLLSLIFVTSLIGCSENAETTGPATVGTDKDEHSCVASAGYMWCAKTNQCERPWELAEQAGFEHNQSNVEAYCKQE